MKTDDIARFIDSGRDTLVVVPENCEIIKKGLNAAVFLYGDAAIKVPKYSDANLDLIRERDIQRKIYEAGYPTPKPYSVLDVEIEGADRKLVGLFMERIYGKDLEDLGRIGKMDTGPLFMEAGEIVGSIGRELGIHISKRDALRPKNVMYNEDNGKVTLIDFGDWFEGVEAS